MSNEIEQTIKNYKEALFIFGGMPHLSLEGMARVFNASTNIIASVIQDAFANGRFNEEKVTYKTLEIRDAKGRLIKGSETYYNLNIINYAGSKVNIRRTEELNKHINKAFRDFPLKKYANIKEIKKITSENFNLPFKDDELFPVYVGGIHTVFDEAVHGNKEAFQNIMTVLKSSALEYGFEAA